MIKKYQKMDQQKLIASLLKRGKESGEEFSLAEGSVLLGCAYNTFREYVNASRELPPYIRNSIESLMLAEKRSFAQLVKLREVRGSTSGRGAE